MSIGPKWKGELLIAGSLHQVINYKGLGIIKFIDKRVVLFVVIYQENALKPPWASGEVNCM